MSVSAPNSRTDGTPFFLVPPEPTFEPNSDENQTDEREAGNVKRQAKLEPARPDLQFEPPGGVGANREFPLRLGAAPVGEHLTAIDQPPRAGVLVDGDS